MNDNEGEMKENREANLKRKGSRNRSSEKLGGF